MLSKDRNEARKCNFVRTHKCLYRFMTYRQNYVFVHGLSFICFVQITCVSPFRMHIFRKPNMYAHNYVIVKVLLNDNYHHKR